MALNRTQILEAKDLPREEVAVPEWGGTVFVRTMRGSERAKFEQEHLNKQVLNVRERLMVACVVDEEGENLFTDDDIPALANKSAAVMDRIAEVALKLNGVSKQDVDSLEKK